MIIEAKTCRNCKGSFPLSNFTVHTRNKNTGHTTYRPDCNPCIAAKKRSKYCSVKNASQMLKKNYGITLAEYDQMAEAQGHKCAVCESTDPKGNGARFAVDHDHKTGAVRGLLCQECNTGIGKFRDDPALLTSAIEYLRDHANV